MWGSPWQQNLLARLVQFVPAYIVGGAVRNAELGLAARDLDVLVPMPLEELADLLRTWGYVPHLLGAGRQTVTLFHAGERLDIAWLSKSVEDDARHRDFTINALYWDCRNRQLADPLGGLHDLRQRSLRACGEAGERFREDPVRLLRMVRLAVQLACSVEQATWEAGVACLPWLGKAAPERVTEELSKILLLPDVVQGLGLLDKLGYFRAYLPELARLQGLEQNRYHTMDAWEHTVQVVGNTPPRLLLRLAALFHDLGKWETASRECYVRGRLQRSGDQYRLEGFRLRGKALDCWRNKEIEVLGGRLDHYPDTVQVKRIRANIPRKCRFEWVPEGKRHFLGHERESAVLTRRILPRFRWGMFLEIPGNKGEQHLITLIESHMLGTLTFMKELRGEGEHDAVSAKARRFAWEIGWTGRDFAAERVHDLLALWRADFFGGKARGPGDGDRLEAIQREIREACKYCERRLAEVDWDVIKDFAQAKGVAGKEYGRFKQHLRHRAIANAEADVASLDFLEREFRSFRRAQK